MRSPLSILWIITVIGFLTIIFSKHLANLDRWFAHNPLYKGKLFTILWGKSLLGVFGKNTRLIYQIFGLTLMVIGLLNLAIVYKIISW